MSGRAVAVPRAEEPPPGNGLVVPAERCTSAPLVNRFPAEDPKCDHQIDPVFTSGPQLFPAVRSD